MKRIFWKLNKQPKQHFFGIDPFVKAESSRFGGIRHDIVFEIENRFAKWPGRGVMGMSSREDCAS